MKATKFILVFALFGLFLAQTQSYGQKKNSAFYYPVKSAYIEYVQSGATNGTETMYVDNNGRLSARYSDLTTKSLGTTTKTKQIVIQKDSVVYTIDTEKKTGSKVTISFKPEDVEKWADTSEKMYKDLGFKKTGEGVVLGKKCDIWEGMSSKIWIWQNFALKSEINIFGKTVIEAKKIDIGGAIDKSKFEIPADIKMTESTLSASDPVFDSIGSGMKQGLKDLQNMFAPKKKK
jgi:hypothetical protein